MKSFQLFNKIQIDFIHIFIVIVKQIWKLKVNFVNLNPPISKKTFLYKSQYRIW